MKKGEREQSPCSPPPLDPSMHYHALYSYSCHKQLLFGSFDMLFHQIYLLFKHLHPLGVLYAPKFNNFRVATDTTFKLFILAGMACGRTTCNYISRHDGISSINTLIDIKGVYFDKTSTKGSHCFILGQWNNLNSVNAIILYFYPTLFSF